MGSPTTGRKSRTVTRRRLLGAFGALATGSGAAVVGSPRTALATAEIATVAAGGRAVQTATVPAAWRDRERHARTVLGAVRDRYADVAGVLDVSLGVDGDPVAERATSSIDLHVDPAVGVDGSVPSAFDGVRSRVVEAADPEPLCESRSDALALGGATTVRAETGATASATCEITWRGDEYLMTCAHLFKGSRDACDGFRGLEVFAATGERIGRVAAVDSAQDWALIERDSSTVGFERAISGVPGTPCGRVTADGLQFLKSEATAVYKKGQATPERAGPIRAVGVRHGGCDLRDGRAGNHYVDVDVPARPGDSGGPVYHRFEYNGREFLALVGAVSASVEYTRASAAYAMHDAHGIEFPSAVPRLG